MLDDATKKCPYCMETVLAEAKKCKFCGEILDPVLRELQSLKQNNGGNVIVNQSVAIPISSKSRVVYIVLALIFGLLGVHNFYAGRTGSGIAQLLLTLTIGWLAVPIVIVAIWVLVEILSVNTDGRGIPFA